MNRPRRQLGIRVSFALALALAMAAVPACSTPQPAPGPTGFGKSGMVVAPERHAAIAGRDVLVDGGNAVDAAVATALALAVTYPQAGNLAGGGFLLYRAPDGAYAALDFRELAPAALTAAMFLDERGDAVPERSLRGGLAVGVPGSVAGLAEAHARWGRLDWARLVEPALRLAERGFEVYPTLHRDLVEDGDRLLEDAEASRIFAPGGDWPAEGERWTQPDLARTLAGIAAEGPSAFYEGDVGRALVETVRAYGGVLAADDLLQYRVATRVPVETEYRGHRIVSFPPPSSGGIVMLQALEMLESLPPDLGDPDHRMVEVERRAYADRSEWIGDADFVDVPLDRLLDPAYLAARAAGIGGNATPSSQVAPGEFPPLAIPAAGDTLHLSITDAEGGAVALTTTLNSMFGSGIVAAGTGVLLNNEIDDFALAPGVPNQFGLLGGERNAVAPRKRPLSSMTPTIVEPLGEEGTFLVLGSPGGSKIITSVLQVLLHVIDDGWDLERAVSAPRLHHQWYPDEVWVEPGIDAGRRRALTARGHRVVEKTMLGNVNAIARSPRGWFGVADPRRAGTAAGCTLP